MKIQLPIKKVTHVVKPFAIGDGTFWIDINDHEGGMFDGEADTSYYV